MPVPRTLHLLDGNAVKPLATLEAEIVAAALKREPNMTRCAAALGISRSTLYYKMRVYKLDSNGEPA